MCLKLILFAFLISFVNCEKWTAKCDFLDSINITDGHEDTHGNFIHNGVTFRPGTFAIADFIYANFNEKIQVDRHYRGCICLYKSCIRVCCENEECESINSLEVPTADEPEKVISMKENIYGVLTGRPCGQMYQLEPIFNENEQWVLNNVSCFKAICLINS